MKKTKAEWRRVQSGGGGSGRGVSGQVRCQGTPAVQSGGGGGEEAGTREGGGGEMLPGQGMCQGTPAG